MVYKSGCIIYGLDFLLRTFMCFPLKVKKVVYTHAHFQYTSDVYLARFRTLGKTAEVFELSHKNIPFDTGCGNINNVDFSMLITWMSDRGATMETNH